MTKYVLKGVLISDRDDSGEFYSEPKTLKQSDLGADLKEHCVSSCAVDLDDLKWTEKLLGSGS